MLKNLQTIGRISLAALLIAGVYQETGICTASAIALIAVVYVNLLFQPRDSKP